MNSRQREGQGRQQRALFQNDGECLYRNDSSGVYYALIKRGGKQIRRSRRTTDRKLAERRLAEFRERVQGFSPSPETGRVTFPP